MTAIEQRRGDEYHQNREHRNVIINATSPAADPNVKMISTSKATFAVRRVVLSPLRKETPEQRCKSYAAPLPQNATGTLSSAIRCKSNAFIFYALPVNASVKA